MKYFNLSNLLEVLREKKLVRFKSEILGEINQSIDEILRSYKDKLKKSERKEKTDL